MFTWLKKLFDLFSQPKEPARSQILEEIQVKEDAVVPSPPLPGGQAALDSAAVVFLKSLLCPEDNPVDLSGLTQPDREFVASNMRRLKRKEFEIPLLPGATVRIQQMLANPDASLAELADIFKTDPTLSAELLSLANSSYLSYIYPTLDLKQAIIRVGTGQLQGLVMMFSLRSRILHTRKYQSEVTWVTELSLALARVCQLLAQELKMSPEEAFTLGLMHHIEYLVILGEAAKYTIAHRGETVTRSAISESIRRVGTQLHSLIAQSWGITSFEKYYQAATGDAENGGDVSEVPRRLDRLQHILIEAMGGGNPEVEIAGFNCQKLKGYVEELRSPGCSPGTTGAWLADDSLVTGTSC